MYNAAHSPRSTPHNPKKKVLQQQQQQMTLSNSGCEAKMSHPKKKTEMYANKRSGLNPQNTV